MPSVYQSLQERLFDPEHGVIAKLEEQIQGTKRVNQFLIEKINSLERSLHSTEQYTRKESIELMGFDPDIPDDRIERSVLNVLNTIKGEGEPEYVPTDIQACHKLRNNKIVICKFVSRKRMRATVNNRKKLKGMNDLKRFGVKEKLVIFEAMSPHFKSINWKCKQLMKSGLLKDSWFFNGKYNVILPNGEKKSIITDADLHLLLQLTNDDIIKVCEQWKNEPFNPPRRAR